jgi:hypothetical protein
MPLATFLAARLDAYLSALSAFDSAAEGWAEDDGYEGAYEVAADNLAAAHDAMDRGPSDWLRGHTDSSV